LLDRRTAPPGRRRLRPALALAAALAAGPGAAAGAPLLGQVFPDGLPYPFEAVLAGLSEAAGPENVQTALVPIGRSLQRYAADPDYFASPRIVVAVIGDRAAGPGGLRLADRLFLGYQPAAQVVEAISYDWAAGRFAFEEVVGYGPDGGTPEPAERRVCLACHQGAGPIFARPLWSETNAAAAVAERLRGLGESFHGAPVRQTVDALEGIDAATDRAALLPVADRLWSEGCPDAACRAALLVAALRVGLGAEPPTPAPGFRAAALWPEGIAAASPDLPNRDPLPVHDAGEDIQADGAFDPETPRIPVALWAPGPDGFAAAARAVAAQLSPGDYRWIEARLARRPAAAETVSLPCVVSEAALPSGVIETRFACADGARRIEGFRRPDRSGRIAVTLGAPSGRQVEIGPEAAPARLADGRRLDGFALDGGSVRLRLVDDLGSLGQALAASGDPALGPGPFRRAEVLALVAALLGGTDG
jgi:hypothetical protein